MSNYAAHQQLVNDILLAVSQSGLARVWPQPTGVARPLSDPEAVITYGIPGQADISGILLTGFRLEIEVKTGSGKLSSQQRNWRAMIVHWRGCHIQARSVEQVLREIREFIAR